MNIARWMAILGIVGMPVMGWADPGPMSSAQPTMKMEKSKMEKSSTGSAAAKDVPSSATSETASENDFGDFSSETLTTRAWKAFEEGDYAAAEAYTTKCTSLYESQAVQQAKSLTDFAPQDKAFNYWALNDVATSYFLMGKIHLVNGRVKEAQEAFHTVIDRFPFAQSWDPKGWFWKVAEAASDKLSTIGTVYDFGDYTSQTLTTKAWQALKQNDHKGVELFTKKCVELYEGNAKKQQAALTNFAPKDKAFDSWALNDVATCYFILGDSLVAQKRYQEAKATFQRVVDDFGFAQCWDPQGWFWKVAVAARGRLNKIMAESS